MLDLVFSIDSIITAVGMTNHIPIMVIAVLVTVALMMVAATPLANFINRNPTLIILALGFLLMIGMVLIADGFGAHVPKGYIYTAMAFSAMSAAIAASLALPPTPNMPTPGTRMTRGNGSSSFFFTALLALLSSK